MTLGCWILVMAAISRSTWRRVELNRLSLSFFKILSATFSLVPSTRPSFTLRGATELRARYGKVFASAQAPTC